MKILPANIVTCLSDKTVGTKVTNFPKFYEVMEKAVAAFDFAAANEPGQGFIRCDDLVPYLSAGVGKASENPEDYVLRFYRGRVRPFLKREKAAACEGAALVVYTRAAYLADPDTDATERARVEASGATHVLVAVLGFAGPKAPLSPDALVHNLAGGNNEAMKWTTEVIHKVAKESDDYYSEWSVVAD